MIVSCREITLISSYDQHRNFGHRSMIYSVCRSRKNNKIYSRKDELLSRRSKWIGKNLRSSVYLSFRIARQPRQVTNERSVLNYAVPGLHGPPFTSPQRRIQPEVVRHRLYRSNRELDGELECLQSSYQCLYTVLRRAFRTSCRAGN